MSQFQPIAKLLDSVSPLPFQKAGFFDVQGGEQFDLSMLPDIDFVAFRSKTKIDQNLIRATGNKMILLGRGGTGTDNVNMNAATEAGLIVFNTPKENALSVAEGVIWFLLGAFHRLTAPMLSLASGKWNRGQDGRELAGKTLGIVGYGAVGSKVAEFARSFGMDVICFEINPKIEVPHFVHRVDTKQLLLAHSDAITLHIPLTNSTKDFINEDAIAIMKNGAVVINTSRAEVVNPCAMLNGINQRGMICGLDVFANESATAIPDDAYVSQRALIQAGGLILIPHKMASTVEAQARIAQKLYDDARAFFAEGIMPAAANFPPHSVRRVGNGGRLLLTHRNVSGALEAILSVPRSHGLNLSNITTQAAYSNQAAYTVLDFYIPPPPTMFEEFKPHIHRMLFIPNGNTELTPRLA